MLIKTLAIAAALAASPAWAINKCTQPDGRVAFQDAPCEGKGETIQVRPSAGDAQTSSTDAPYEKKRQVARIEQRAKINAAIARGEPMVGMTRLELDQAMGQPTKVNANNYSGRLKDQIIYHRPGQKWYVYTEDGMVTSIQHRPDVNQTAQTRVICPSPLEIKAMETSASSITLSEREKIERLRQIAEARRCGR